MGNARFLTSNTPRLPEADETWTPRDPAHALSTVIAGCVAACGGFGILFGVTLGGIAY